MRFIGCVLIAAAGSTACTPILSGPGLLPIVNLDINAPLELRLADAKRLSLSPAPLNPRASDKRNASVIQGDRIVPLQDYLPALQAEGIAVGVPNPAAMRLRDNRVARIHGLVAPTFLVTAIGISFVDFWVGPTPSEPRTSLASNLIHGQYFLAAASAAYATMTVVESERAVRKLHRDASQARHHWILRWNRKLARRLGLTGPSPNELRPCTAPEVADVATSSH